MALKRKPPTGNIRRVAPIGENLRYAITSKDGETVQCESFQERKLAFVFERDPTVQAYRSQPERFAFTDSQGALHTYVPDFIVWKTTGEIEIHEVTLTSRRENFSSGERVKAPYKTFSKRGWRHVLHTDTTPPWATAK